jgi:hypothetical protein
MKNIFILIITTLFLFACGANVGQEAKDVQAVAKQQSQYAIGQPVLTFNWSLERHLVIQLYQIRNQKVATHSVWRSDRGIVEGDCPSIGFGIPYDTSLTNPLMATDEDMYGYDKAALTSVEQAEPNGIFASKNTSATWVMCAGNSGMIEPVYVETKVTVYPYPVAVDYNRNYVEKSGKSSVNLKISQ